MESQEQKSEYLSTGQIAKQTGLTVRTLRYYDQIGLLKPSKYGQSSQRLYNRQDLIRLQQIQTLKYIGLSLIDIKRMVEESKFHEQDLGSSLRMQRDVLLQKAADLQFVLKAINEAIEKFDEAREENVDWKAFAALIHTVHSEKEWAKQYQTANWLQTRIDLYEKCGVNKQGWHRWFFEQLGKQTTSRILEIGCGDGALWSRNADRTPEAWNITLTDISPGMLDEARRNIGDSSGRFKFIVADVQSIPFHAEQFDLVIANHMLYHVPDLPRALSEISRVMKPHAYLYASTMSKRHLEEIDLIAQSFDPEMRVLDPVMERFSLDNGQELLSKNFSDVRVIRYEDHLLVNEVQPLLKYMVSTPMNAREILIGKKRNQFIAFLQEKLKREGNIQITSDSGFFLACKS